MNDRLQVWELQGCARIDIIIFAVASSYLLAQLMISFRFSKEMVRYSSQERGHCFSTSDTACYD